MAFSLVFFILDILLSELCFRLSAYGSVSITFFLLIFTISTGCLLAGISLFFTKKGRQIFNYIVTIILFFFYSINLVYQHIFKSFLSVSQLGMGGDAVTTYIKETLIGIGESAPYLAGLLLPLLFLIFSKKLRKKTLIRIHKHEADGVAVKLKTLLKSDSLKAACVCLGCSLVFHLIGLVFLPFAGREAYSPFDIYSDTFVLSMSQKHFGALTSTRLELKGLFFGSSNSTIVDEGPVEDDPQLPEDKPDQKPVEYNKMSFDFKELAENESDEKIKAIHNYFDGRTATNKNDYTGMFEGYNVITLLCESYSPYLLDAERTPMLYKMANEGFLFNDYYGTICDNTNNSEYVLFNSLLPDTSLLGKGWDTFYTYNSCTASVGHSFPFTIGNQMKKLGVRSIGYHYYWGNYYGRNKSHPGFGYDFYSMSNFFKKSEDWPTSDLQMMEQALPKLLAKNADGKVDPFNAYFLTFSGHMQYRFDTNNIARKNQAVSDDLDVSTASKAYVSCNQELEYAVEYLVEKLDEAGVLNNTLIVLLPDHYPYTLGLDKLSELAGKDLQENDFESEFNQYRGCLLMWSASMENPVEVNTTCCELDILPTLSNLLGFEFDSRLMLGSDVFADGEHVAILGDRSFVTDKVFYNAQNGEVTYRNEEAKNLVSDYYVQRYINIIKNKFTISTEILYTDYFSYLK